MPAIRRHLPRRSRCFRTASVGPLAGVVLLLGLGGCVTESSTTTPASPWGNGPGVGADGAAATSAGGPGAEDTLLPPAGSAALTDPEARIESRTSRATAVVTPPIATIEYDGSLLPLVQPAGGFLATQEPPMIPSATVLAMPGDAPDFPTAIRIHEIVLDEAGRTVGLRPGARIVNAGILGRHVDDEGFFVEQGRPDGSRRIGKADWVTGEVDWLIDDPAYQHAHAVASPEGRLAWCRRPADDPAVGTDLVIQRAENRDRLDVIPGAEDSGWLYPTWSRDGGTLFAYRLHAVPVEPRVFRWQLDLLAFDVRGDAFTGAPIAEYPLIRENGSPSVAFGTLAAIQHAVPPTGADRYLFYHPGLEFGRVCALDPRGGTLRRLAPGSIGGTWLDDGSFVLVTEDAVVRQADQPGAVPVELIKGTYVPRQTESEIVPYLLFAPATADPDGAFDVLVMDIVDEAEAALPAAATRP